MNKRSIIKASDYYQFSVLEGAKTLTVLFNSRNVRPPKFTFWKKWQGLNSHLIFLNCDVDEWFRDGVPGIKGSVDGVVSEILRFKEEFGAENLVTSGSSMGGFGAMLYGSLARADSTLVFGVEPLLGVPGGNSEHTRNHLQYAFPDITQLETRPKTTLFYGGMDIADTLGASLIAERWGGEVLCVPEAQHDTPDFLDRSGRLDLCFCSAADRLPIPKFDYSEGGATDRALVELLWRVNSSYVSKRWPEVVKLTKGRAEVDRSSLLKFILGSAFFRLGDLSSARTLISAVTDEQPGYWEGWGTLSAIHVREKDLELAEAAAIKAVKLRPHRSMAHAQLGNIYKYKGAKEKAYVHYLWACRLNYQKPEYKQALAGVAESLSKTFPPIATESRLYAECIDAAIASFADYALVSPTIPSDRYV